MRLVVLLAGLCALLPQAAADNYARQPGIDVQHYVFRVSLSDSTDEISGEATIVVRFVRDGVAAVTLDLTSQSGGKGMSVSAVTSEGAAVSYTHEADHLRITLPAAPRAGELREFTVQYHGLAGGGLKTVRNKYGERCFFSENWPDLARQWLPSLDHPYDKATSEFVITAPSRYQVVANGRLAEELDLGDGRRTTHWKESAPIATWLNNIGVAQFSSRNSGTASGVPLQTWVFPQDRESGSVTFDEPMRQSIEFYSEHIGPYPYEKLASVQNGGSDGGGMEHASAIFYGQNTVKGQPALRLVSHEVAHQWFGDSVTESDWDDVWLSEGFATYFSLLTIEHYEGRDAFIAGLKRSRARVLETEKRIPGVAVVQDKAWSGIPNEIVYQKGAWVLHMLRAQLGTEKFWAGIREYYRRYRDGSASTQDFRKVMEEAAGSDLNWFFQQWVTRTGSPKVEGKWKYDAGAKRIELELTQTQAGEAYRLPLEIGVMRDGLTRVQKIEMTGKRQRFEIAAEREPVSVELDPNTSVLVDGKLEKR